MTDREERLEEALLQIKQWAEAYPVEVFLPVSQADLLTAGVMLEAMGVNMGALHAAWARHILNGVGEICDKALGEVN